MVREAGLQGRVGVHLNLTEGQPITDAIRRCSRLCSADGQMRHGPGTIWRLAPDDARAVEIELTAQIEAALAAGITPSHLDSHHHIHTHWAVCTVVMHLARRYRIPAIRLSRNCGPVLGLLRRSYKVVFNARLAYAGYARTDRFGSARDAEFLTGSVRALEIMTHPDLDAQGRVVDVTTGAGPLEDVARDWGAVANLVSYRELWLPCARRTAPVGIEVTPDSPRQSSQSCARRGDPLGQSCAARVTTNRDKIR